MNNTPSVTPTSADPYPLQTAAIATLERKGFRFVCWFNEHNQDDENAQCATMSVRRSSFACTSCEVDSAGLCNGLPVDAFLAREMVRRA